MTEFVKFEEYNDHEGERWYFWLELGGNEDGLRELASALEGNDSYRIDLSEQPVPESEVDVLVKHAEYRYGYNQLDTKVVGTFTPPNFGDDFDPDDFFYKGGIEDFFLKVGS